MTPHLSEEAYTKLERIVREAKPRKKSLEWGPETRYGREDDDNTGYNDGLDEYEDTLLTRLAETAMKSRPETTDDPAATTETP